MVRCSSRIGSSDSTPLVTGKKSISRAEPDCVSNVVSSTGVKPRYRRLLVKPWAGRIEQSPPRAGLRIFAKIDGES